MNRKLLSVEELAEYLNVRKSWIYDRTYRNEIPHFKMGRLVRFDLDKVLEWLNGKKRNARP